MASNRVLNGDYKNAPCGMCMDAHYSHVEIRDTVDGCIPLTRTTVINYTVVDAEERRSATSGVLRAGAGALLLGPIGLAAGLSAKRKGTYTIAVMFNDGKRSLIEIDEKLYKQFIRDVF